MLSPILVRPVREQLEHDRVIRLLQAKYKRKFDVAINPGTEQTAAVGTGPFAWYPDLVLQSNQRGRKLLGVVEVETAESVNNLEAMSQWASLSRLRAPFHLYVPAGSIDSARRLCNDLQISVAEIWAYHALGDQLRFTLVHREGGARASDGRSRPSAAARAGKGRGRPSMSRSSAAGSARRGSGKPRRSTARSRASATKAKSARSNRNKKRASAPRQKRK